MKIRFERSKGFSLVELLIVLAILAIIAAVSISIFANVLENQKRKSDMAQASYLQSAIQTYITDSDDSNLTRINNASDSVADIVNGLKKAIVDNISNTEYGPYLKSDFNYGTRSNKYKGFEVTIDSTAQSVDVKLSTTSKVTFK